MNDRTGAMGHSKELRKHSHLNSKLVRAGYVFLSALAVAAYVQTSASGQHTYRVWTLAVAGCALGLAGLLAAVAFRVGTRVLYAVSCANILTAASVAVMPWPLMIAFLVHRTHLEELVSEFRSTGHGAESVERDVGIIRVHGIVRLGWNGGVLLQTAPVGSGFVGIMRDEGDDPEANVGPIIQQMRLARGWFYVSWE